MTASHHFRKGIGAKIVGLGVIPMLAAVAGFSVAIVLLQTSSRQAAGLATEQSAQMADLSKRMIVLKDGSSEITAASGKLFEVHLSALLTQDPDAVKTVRDSRAAVEAKVKRFVDQVNDLEAHARDLGIQGRPFATAEEAAGTDPAVLAAGNLSLLLGLSRTLPNLMATFSQSNEATLKLLAAANFDGAASNFTYEESARLSTFNTALGRVGSVATRMTEAFFDVSHAQALARIEAIKAREATLMAWTWGLAALLVAGLATATLLFSRHHLSRPLTGLAETMRLLSTGDLGVEIRSTGRQDEVGEMARAVQVFKDNAAQMAAMRHDQDLQKRHAEAGQRAALNRLADNFQTSVLGVVEDASASAGEMQATARSMSDAARQSSSEAASAAAGARQATASVQTVAAAAEQLSSSIAEISRQAAQAAKTSTTAAEEAARTNEMVRGLAAAADKIGAVVNLINTIAAQTNLLALNATIEAARAGDAGKGFAVVANEVKHLANQTQMATGEIAAQVASIQGETKLAVEAIRTIGEVIDQVRRISSGIAVAVDQQGAATREIAANVQQAAAGTQDVADNIAGVLRASAVTGSASEQVVASAAGLAQSASRLRAEVTTFLASVKAG